MDPEAGAETPSSEELSKSLSRFKRRLSREKAARLEAEAIADRGLRELWLANRELDKRVAERTADLERTLEELEVVTKTRENFLSALSHEMRTPLNGVLGMLELLSPYIEKDQPLTYLGAAQESADNLSVLICRMLDLVELSNGTIGISPVETTIGSLTDQITARWQHELLKTGRLLSVSSYVDGTLPVRLDVDRWHQIVNELVANTVDHADPGAVKVRIMTNGLNLVVEVEDPGPGIVQEFDQITLTRSADFEANRSSDGLGLGLVFGRQMAEAMGGRLSVTSRRADRRSDQESGVPPGGGTLARLETPAELDQLAKAVGPVPAR